MSDTDQTPNEEQPQEQQGGGYHVSDLPEGATPDPLGDGSLTPRERAGASDTNE